jgi:hypothetical protein
MILSLYLIKYLIEFKVYRVGGIDETSRRESDFYLN